MNRLDEIDLSSGAAAEPEILLDGSASGSQALVDLPLRPAAAGVSRPAARLPESAAPGVRAQAAPLSARGAAFAADSALVLLLIAAALLAATAGRGQAFELVGLLWTGVFAFYLSFFSTVVPLILFGKTVGMALTGLTARGPKGSVPLTTTQSARRWLGTALTLLTLGVPLLVTRRDRGSPSLSDRLSGRPLVWEGRESRVESREFLETHEALPTSDSRL
ncbi:MAG TPA: RDD family protein [Thermoanaerobaculia bacterium]